MSKTIKNADPALYNADMAPATEDERTWGMWSFASLWVAMVVCVPTYMLSGGLIAAGMNWWQAVLTVFLGNVIVLVPMVLIGQMGTKYGVPFPVLLRSAFGTKGAKIPAIARGLVACGWFGKVSNMTASIVAICGAESGTSHACAMNSEASVR